MLHGASLKRKNHSYAIKTQNKKVFLNSISSNFNIDRNLIYEALTFTYKHDVYGEDFAYQLILTTNEDQSSVYLIYNLESNSVNGNQITDIPYITVRDVEGQNVICSAYLSADFVQDVSTFLDCTVDIESGCNDANVLAPNAGGLGDFAYKFSEEGVVGVLTCNADDNLKLYSRNVIIGEDLPSYEKYTCIYDEDRYITTWSEGDYECQPIIPYEPCQNNEFDCRFGDCYTDGFEVECRCWNGFESPENTIACTKNFNECLNDDDNLCANGSICQDLDPELHSFTYTCDCPPEFYNDPVIWNQDGKQDELGQQYVPLNGYCEQIHIDCIIDDADPCQEYDVNAVCTDGVRVEQKVPNYTCECSDGYVFDGLTCVPRNPCLDNPCLNNGICNWTGGPDEYTCTCLPEFRGDNCEDPVTYCNPGDLQPCHPDNSDFSFGVNGCLEDPEQGFKCICKDGFKGQTCAISTTRVVVKKQVFSLGRTCENGDGSDPTENDLILFEGPVLNLITKYWLDRGAEEVVFSKLYCQDFKGKNMHGAYEIKIREDNLVARRRNLGDDVSDLFDGLEFDELSNFDDAFNDAADEFLTENADELADLGLTDVDTSTGLIDDLEQLDNNQVETIIEEEDICKTNFANDSPGGCLNGSYCYDTIDPITAEQVSNCDCAGTGYEGEFCEILINFCDPNPCLNNSVCHSNVDSFYCDCPDHFSGETCEVDDFCAQNLCQNEQNCDNAACDCGNVVVANPNQSFVSEGVFCEVRNYCAFSNPCNAGTCINKDYELVDDESGYICMCGENFTGENCEIDIEVGGCK